MSNFELKDRGQTVAASCRSVHPSSCPHSAHGAAGVWFIIRLLAGDERAGEGGGFGLLLHRNRPGKFAQVDLLTKSRRRRSGRRRRREGGREGDGGVDYLGGGALKKCMAKHASEHTGTDPPTATDCSFLACPKSGRRRVTRVPTPSNVIPMHC